MAGIEKMVPSYLQISLESLAREQDRFRAQFAGAFTPQGAFEAYQEQARKNIAMIEKAMTMFTPFGKAGAAGTEGAVAEAEQPTAAAPAPQPMTAGADEIAELKAQLATMQARIEKLSSKD